MKKYKPRPTCRTFDITKGDTVVVLSGSEKGKTGRVLYVYPKKGEVIVEKVRLIKRHTKPGRRGMTQGGIVEKESPLPISKVALLDPKTGKPTRVRHQVGADKTKLRFGASGDVIERSRS
jgi:large subunit ribosomal protein L24